jgi:hypothetical protein
MRRSATSERELLRAWNAGAPIDGRERDPPPEQLSIYDGDFPDGLDDTGDPIGDEDDDSDCGYMGPKLGCSQAGTEYCDWDCPTRRYLDRRRRRKRGKP